MKTAFAALAALGLVFSAAPAAAQTTNDVQPAPSSGDPVLDDLLCFMAGGSDAPDASATQRQALLVLGIYYTGKLFGRDPNFDLGAAVAKYEGQLMTFDYLPQLRRCNDEFMAVGQKLVDFGSGK